MSDDDFLDEMTNEELLRAMQPLIDAGYLIDSGERTPDGGVVWMQSPGCSDEEWNRLMRTDRSLPVKGLK